MMVYNNMKEADLINRVTRNLRDDYPDNPMAVMLWKGYIDGIFTRSRRLTLDDYDDLEKILPQAYGEEGHVYALNATTAEERSAALQDYKAQMERIATRKDYEVLLEKLAQLRGLK